MGDGIPKLPSVPLGRILLQDTTPTATPWAEMNRPVGTKDKKAEPDIPTAHAF